MFRNKKKNDIKIVPVSKTVQGSIPFTEYYENGIFRVSENTYAVVCRFTGNGYFSKTDSEQERKYRTYAKMLAELPEYIHYQEIVYNKPVNVEDYVAAIASKQDGYRDQYDEAFFSVQRRFAEQVEREISVKRYLATVSTTVEDGETPFNKLFDAVDAIRRRFKEMGADLFILSPDEVFAELYHCYNPFGGEMQSIPPDIYRKGINVKDYIASDSMIMEKGRVRLGDALTQIYTVQSFGAEVTDRLIYSILNNNLPITAVKHIEHISKEAAIKTVKARLDELEQNRQKRLEKNARNHTTFIPIDLVRSIQGCEQLLDSLSGDDELIRQTIYITISAETEDELKTVAGRVQAAASACHATLRQLNVFLEKTFLSTLPMGQDYLMLHKLLLSSEAAVITPFSYESYFDAGGYFYGYNYSSQEPVVINRRLDKSSHGFVFGVTGAGKGIFVKNETSNHLYQPVAEKDRVIVIDASGEYVALAEAFGDCNVIEMEATTERAQLNPLYISPAQKELLGEHKARSSKVLYMIALLNQLKSGAGLTPGEKAIVDDVCIRCFRHGRNANLEMFYNFLQADSREEAKNMCSWLIRYVHGSVTLFAGKNMSEDENKKKITLFSVKSLSGDLRDACMLAMLERIEEQIMENHRQGRWTWVYIEEMHRYFDGERNPYAAQRISRFFAEMRKFGAIITGITQLPRPVIESKEGSTMLSNSRFIVLSELDGDNIDAVAGAFALNEEQRRILSAPDVGQYVIRTHNSPMSVKLLYPGAKDEDHNLMYDLFNTSAQGKGQ